MQKTEDMDGLAAEMEWQRRLSNPQQKQDKNGVNGAPRLLIAIEDFVVCYNEKSQIEQTTWGVKDKKNPADGDIQALEDVMGTDHHAFDSQFYSSISGVPRGGEVASNLFSTPSAPAAPVGEAAASAASSALSPGVPNALGTAASKADGEPEKKRRKAFDAQGVLTKLVPDIRNFVSNAEAKANTALVAAGEALKLSESSPHAELFSTAAALLQKRVAALKAILGAELGKDATVEEHMKVVKDYKDKPDVKQEYEDKKEPCVSWSHMKCFKQVEAEAMEIEVVDEDSVKQEKERTKSLMKPLDELVTRVKEQRQRLVQALKTRESRDAKEAEKQKRADEQSRLANRVNAEQAQLEKERRPSGAAAVVRSFSIFTFQVAEFKDIPTTTEADLKDNSGTCDFSIPMVVTNCDQLEAACNNLSGFSETRAKFEEDWMKSPQRKPEGSGRAARYVDAAVIATSLLDATSCMRPQPLKLKAALSEADMNSFQNPWHFAYSPTMRAVGPEFSFMASVKYTFKGDRHVIMFPIDSLVKYFSDTMPTGTICNLKKLSNLVTECCLEGAIDMAKRMPVYACTVQPSTVLYTPAGFLVVEQVMNNTDVEGIRWVALPAADAIEDTAPFEAMVKLLQPSDSATPVPASMTLMMKVHAAVKAATKPAPAAPLKTSPIKAKAVASPARAMAPTLTIESTGPAGGEAEDTQS